MKTMTKPYTQTPPPPRMGWSYDHYFLEQLARIKHQAEVNSCKTAIN